MDTVTLLATLPAIVALVTLFKKLGLVDNLALVVAVLLGVALSAADYLWSGTGLYNACSTGLILGLGAAGIYDTAKAVPATKVLTGAVPSAVLSVGSPITGTTGGFSDDPEHDEKVAER